MRMADSKAPENGNNIIHVLHVDDDSSNLEISKTILLEMGNFTVDFASCVDEALGKLAMKDYDVVVSDYEMPQKTGLDFLLELKRQKNDVPFILFTGKGREEVAIKALNLGASGYFNKQGSPETVYGELSHGIRQIVERKKAEEALRNSEENFRAYLESSPISIFVANSNGKYEYVNLAALRLLGFSLKEILNMTVFEVVPKEEVSGLRFKQLNEKGYFAGEMKVKRKNDTLVDVFLSSNRLPDGKLIAFCEDITERKKAEYEIKESIANYQSLINGMSESAWVIDFSGNFLEVNDTACDILGYSKNELLSIGITGIDKYLSGEQVGNRTIGSC
jgi:PAS domain S-box-containing protein